MAFKIYTKTGDKGNTSLIGGVKVPKNDDQIEAYGTVDETNSWIGLCRDLVEDAAAAALLTDIQNRLFVIGSLLACHPDKPVKMQLPHLHAEDIDMLEKAIDTMDEQLPAMKHFILPGGHPLVSYLHIARCVCRRAERCVVGLQNRGMVIDGLIIMFLNRLSDYLFVLSRYCAQKSGVAEIPWVPAKQ